MKNIGKKLNDIIKNIIRIKELDEKIEKTEKRIIKKFLTYAK